MTEPKRRNMRYLTFSTEPLDLGDDRGSKRRHVFGEEDVHAVNAALAAERPLLLRGLPGTGKSQLALASAVGLGRAFVPWVIDARVESRDLLWRFDAVRRLADAQASASADSKERLLGRRRKWLEGDMDLLDESFYIEPGPLWWGLDWASALRQAKKAQAWQPTPAEDWEPEHGVVVLLDEIDKADSSVPNGLLGALGDAAFHVPGVGEVACGDTAPLVVITTNEERSLPAAFLRRCAIHELALPKGVTELRAWLVRLGEAHFDKLGAIHEDAANLVIEDRKTCRGMNLDPPGSAEYLDLLRAVDRRLEDEGSESPERARELLGLARRFLVLKQPKDRDPKAKEGEGGER